MKEGFIKFTILSIFLVIFSAGMPTSKVNAENADFFEQQKLTSHLLINLFLEKVDQDGLNIFDHVLNGSDLHSHHVSYVYRTTNDSFQVQLCFTVSKRILVPDFDVFFVDKITVEMDKEGNILEISTHVSSLDEGQDTEKQ